MRYLNSPSVVVTTVVTPAVGASDTDTLLDAMVPSDNCRLLGFHARQKTAGTGTGTIAAFLKAGSGGVRLSEAIAAIDADAAANTYHGRADGWPQSAHSAVVSEGTQIAINTVKTGTVSAGAVMIIDMIWGL